MIRNISMIIFAVLIATGCGGGGVTYINNKSPEGHTTITINASKVTSMDPWNIDMQVEAYDFKKGSLKFELMAGDLKQDDNVFFKWEDENHCLITFVQRDGDKRNFQLIASPQNVQMAEIK